MILDTHAILHRAFHALPDFSSSKGEPTGALYGVISMLIKIINDLKPEYIVAAYDLPEMKSFISDHPDAKVALDQLAYARGWFSTYNVVGVRKALEDGVQAVLSGKATPAAAMAKAQLEADTLMRPYVEQTALKVPE